MQLVALSLSRLRLLSAKLRLRGSLRVSPSPGEGCFSGGRVKKDHLRFLDFRLFAKCTSGLSLLGLFVFKTNSLYDHK